MLIGAISGLGLSHLIQESHLIKEYDTREHDEAHHQVSDSELKDGELKDGNQLQRRSQASFSSNRSDSNFHLIDHSKNRSYHEFWDIILILDRIYLNSELHLSDTQGFYRLVEFVESCERTLLPAIEHHMLHRRELKHHGIYGENKSYMELRPPKQGTVRRFSAFTQLIQWVFATPTRRKQLGCQARAKHLNAPLLSHSEILNGLNELVRDGSILPSLHKGMLRGISDRLKAAMNEVIPLS